jgi:hypothetical protein
MKILFYDDDGANTIAFGNISAEDVLTELRATGHSLDQAFLQRNHPLTLAGITVSGYSDLQERLDALGVTIRSAGPAAEPVVLLLDCALHQDARAADIVPTLQTLRTGAEETISVVLATTFHPNSVLIPLENASPDVRRLVVAGDPPTKGPQQQHTMLGLCCQGVRLWEQLHGGPYHALFQELLLSSSAALYATHPEENSSDDARIMLFQKHYPGVDVPLDARNDGYVNRQLYELARCDDSDGVGMEALWLLGLMKAAELFPADYKTVFAPGSTWPAALFPFFSRGVRSKVRLLFLPQDRQQRTATLQAFGEVCREFFVKKGDRSFALKAVNVIRNCESTAGSVTWSLDWDDGTFANNVWAVYRFMNRCVTDQNREESRPSHGASNALVSFLTSTAQGKPIPSRSSTRFFLSGTCANVVFASVERPGISEITFGD